MDDLKQYKIDVKPAALMDVDCIIDYLNTLSAQTAEKHLNEINRAINSLRVMPLRCPPVKIDKYARMGYRYLVVEYYLVFFTVEDDAVIIQRIVDGRSDYADHL